MKIFHFDTHDLFIWKRENRRYWLGFYTLENWNIKCWDFWSKCGYLSLHTPCIYFYVSPIEYGTTENE